MAEEPSSTEEPARRHALDLASPAFAAVLDQAPKAGPMIVMGLIEVADGRLYNTAVVVDRGVLVGRYRKAHLLGGEAAALGNLATTTWSASTRALSVEIWSASDSRATGGRERRG